jgi:hypothetical protein
MSSLSTQRFARNLDALRAYAAREGHPNVPGPHIEHTPDGDIDLGRWVSYIRTRHRKGLLSPERAAPLEALPGWNWDTRRPGPQPLLDRNNDIKELRAEGTPIHVIAATYGLSKQRVCQLIHRDS